MLQTAILYIVPTPIGHLEDISQRALKVLSTVDWVVAEDTRRTRTLLHYFNIKKRLLSLHDHNEGQKTAAIVAQLQQGASVALVSDAGTPLISDPGLHLVRHCRTLGIQIIPLPGPCAAITALSASGLATDRFCFEGFLASKQCERLRFLTTLMTEERTLIFYVAPHRLAVSLQDMVSILGSDRQGVLARELTKCWEEFQCISLGKLLDWVVAHPDRCRGEMVLLVAGHRINKQVISPSAQKMLQLLLTVLPLKKAVELTATLSEVNKNTLYRYGIQMRSATSD